MAQDDRAIDGGQTQALRAYIEACEKVGDLERRLAASDVASHLTQQRDAPSVNDLLEGVKAERERAYEQMIQSYTKAADVRRAKREA